MEKSKGECVKIGCNRNKGSLGDYCPIHAWMHARNIEKEPELSTTPEIKEIPKGRIVVLSLVGLAAAFIMGFFHVPFLLAMAGCPFLVVFLEIIIHSIAQNKDIIIKNQPKME